VTSKSASSDNSALLDSIKQFNPGALKRAAVEKEVSPNMQKRLSDQPAADGGNSMLDQLKKALGERQRFLRKSLLIISLFFLRKNCWLFFLIFVEDSSEEDDDDDDESDSEWQ
jgi:hypothetical protein